MSTPLAVALEESKALEASKTSDTGARDVQIELPASNASSGDDAGDADDAGGADDADSDVRPIVHCWHFCCCNTLTETDDLILKQERDRAEKYTEEGAQPHRWMTTGVEIILCVSGFKQPEACRRASSAVGGALLHITWVLYVLLVLCFWMFFSLGNVWGALVCQEKAPAMPDFSGFELFPQKRMHRCSYVQDVLANATNGTGLQAEISALLSADSSYEEYWMLENPYREGNLLISYLEWKAYTKSIVPNLFWLMAELTLWSCIVALVLTFSLRFHTKDLEEILFPAVLQQKQPITKTQTDMREGVLSNYHLVRMRKPMLEMAYSILLCLWAYLVRNLYEYPTLANGVGPIVNTGIFFTLFAALGGVCVQIYNATFLANVLVKGVLRAEPRRVQQRFDEWMEMYKITVGALHVWSWRITWAVGGVLAIFSHVIMWHIVRLVFLYTTFFEVTNADIPEEKRLGFFLESASVDLEALAVLSLGVAVTLVVLALVSSRYKRLRVLVATVRLDQRLDAFEILQANHAAITLYDVPITFKVVGVVVNLIVVQVALLALAATA